jgi:hypothetical protein
MPWKDEIVEGVREARRKLGEAHGNDLRRIGRRSSGPTTES